jgi:hypothetical protein
LVDRSAHQCYNTHMNKQNNTTKPQQPKLVQDRKTGESYDPKAKFDELMNKPEIMAMLKRLSVR